MIGCRACVLYPKETVEVTNGLSKCSIKEVGKQYMTTSAAMPMNRLPLQVPQTIQGLIALFLFLTNGQGAFWSFPLFKNKFENKSRD